ncbi:MAG: hypothetical protein H7210_03645 [Pyrinomonadaceae bacterium]|nr:hypothetical protein [Phycisphaerales bacterium]
MDETDPVQPDDISSGGHPVSAGASLTDARTGQPLDRRLGGDLPCVVCKYNLKGVSIREACPECGTPVRATILAMVDPYARELMPIPRPRLVAIGLVAWGFGALLTALLGWLPYVMSAHSHPWRVALCTSAAISGLGALVLLRPNRGTRLSHCLMALAGVALYVPLIGLIWKLSGPDWVFEPFKFPPMSLDPDAPPRALLRVILDATIAMMLLLLRPNARVLVARSLALRMGRVDRQTMLAMVAAAAAAGIGDLVWLLLGDTRGAMGDAAMLFSRILVVIGSAFLTLGAAGVLIDGYRIARAILVPTPTLAQVIAAGTTNSPS